MKAGIIKRIRGFIRTQRYIGANEKLAVMRERYSEAADEFYKEYGGIYYVNENGQKIGLNIKSIWHFVTLEEKIASLTEQLEKEREKVINQIDKEHERTYQVFDYSDSYCQGLEFCKNLLNQNQSNDES